MKTKHILILVLALIIVSFFAGRISTLRPRNAAYDEISQLTDIVTVYQREISGREQTIYEKNILLASRKEAIEAGILEQDRLKALNLKKARQITNVNAAFSAYKDSIALVGQEFKVDTIFVDSGEVKTNTYIKLPFSWEYKDKFLSLEAGVDSARLGHFTLEAPVDLTITLGGRDGKQVAAVSEESPYIYVTDFNVVRLKEENWYYKPWVPSTAGVIGGVGLGWLIWGR